MMRKILVIMLSVVVVMNSFVLASFAETYDYAVGMTLERVFSITDSEGNRMVVEKVAIDNLDPTKNFIHIDYTINFDSIPKIEISVPQRNKEVVMVLDRSGSMAWDLAGNRSSEDDYSGESRMSILKTAAKTFANKLAENSQMKLGLVSYSSSATVYKKNHVTLLDISNGKNTTGTANKNLSDLVSQITNMNASGGTNMGDAIRLGFQTINSSGDPETTDKYFVFLSDGEPTHYSRNSVNVSSGPEYHYYSSGSDKYYYYVDDGTAPYIRDFNGVEFGRKYADLMTARLVNYNKNYFLSFNTTLKNQLEDIAKNVTEDRRSYQQARTADEITKVYEEISEDILADMKLDNAKYSDILPDGMTLVIENDNPIKDKLTQEGQKFIYAIDNVNYYLNVAGTEYVADPIEFSVKATFDDVGVYEFPEMNSKFDYKDVDGVDKSKHALTDTFTVERNPVKNVTVTRPQEAHQNPKNEVLVAWHVYTGAKSYKIYKLVNGVDVEVGTVTSDNTTLLVPIIAGDGPETTYKVEAILTNDKLSSKGEAKGNTVPSILNLSVVRENDSFIISWDQIDDESNVKYNLLPSINGSPLNLIEDKVAITDADVFDIFNKRVTYKYALQNPDSFDYDADIIFTVDGVKKDKTTNLDIDVVKAVSGPLKIKQYVKTVIETEPTFVYAKSTRVEIDVLSDAPFPEGVKLFDPIIVVELVLPTENSLTPLEFTYPTIEVNNVTGGLESAIGTTITSSIDGDVKLYIQLNDYKNTFLTPGQNMKLHLEYSIAYESSNGLLKASLFTYLRNLYPDLKVYEIENKFTNLLNYHYVTHVDQLVVMNTYLMYNTTSKNVEDATTRDVRVGESSRFLKLMNLSEILDEF